MPCAQVPGPVLCVRHHLESSNNSYEPILQARNEGSEKSGNLPKVTQLGKNGGLWPIGAQGQCQGPAAGPGTGCIKGAVPRPGGWDQGLSRRCASQPRPNPAFTSKRLWPPQDVASCSGERGPIHSGLGWGLGGGGTEGPLEPGEVAATFGGTFVCLFVCLDPESEGRRWGQGGCLSPDAAMRTGLFSRVLH